MIFSMIFFFSMRIERLLAWSRINKTLEVANKASESRAAGAHTPVANQSPPKPAVAAAAPLPLVSTTAPPQPAPQPAPALPVIKLKVGNAQAKAAERPPPEAAKPLVKVAKPRKPTVPDEAPPPYVDDGSHDLLQEVIAIEREKDEARRHRKVIGPIRDSSPNRATGSGPPGKRRKRNVEGEDDILALATPISRKDKAGTSHVSSGTSTPAPEQPTVPLPKSSTPVAPPPKLKKKVSVPEPIEIPAPPVVETPSVSVKGKEKEVHGSQSTTPSRLPRPTSATPINEKKCRDILKVLSRMAEYPIFAQPVDPERDGCPTYVISLHHTPFLIVVQILRGNH